MSFEGNNMYYAIMDLPKDNGFYVNLFYDGQPLTEEQMNVLREKYIFYFWREEIKEVRLMCSFKTTEEDIDCFIEDLERLLS